MATTIRNLPEELLVEMLGNLRKNDLKSARLVCTLWSTAGAKWMFQRVYFAPRQASMKVFADIAANPAFARNVKELIYDGRLFLPEFATSSSYYPRFSDRFAEEFDLCEDHVRSCSLSGRKANFAEDVYQGSIWNRAILGGWWGPRGVMAEDDKFFYAYAGESLARYARLLQQQEDIFTKGKDLKALSEGLNSFRNIQKVGVVVDFSHHLEYDPYAWDRDEEYIAHHQWYSSRSYTEIGFALAPSKWCAPIYLPWNVRGVHNLFRAVSTHCSSLKELRIGSTEYKAPMTIFQLSDVELEKTAAVARDLTTLRLYAYVTKLDDCSEYLKLCSSLRILLNEAKGLRNLSSSSWIPEDLLSDEPPDFGLFLGEPWRYLTKLTLREARVEARDLMMGLRAHMESLRELRLVDIQLLGKGGWEHVGTEIGKNLKLHFVSICRLYDEHLCTPYQACYGREQAHQLVRDMIQWALPSLPEIIEERDAFAASTFTARLEASLETDC